MVTRRLVSAAKAVRGRDSRRALDLLLETFGELRSHDLTARIERTAARVARWHPIELGRIGAMWEWEVADCAPSKLGLMLAALPRDAERVASGLSRRAELDPRIARALAGHPEHAQLVRRHADDAVAPELAVRAWTDAELAALAALDAALDDTPIDPAREAVTRAPELRAQPPLLELDDAVLARRVPALLALIELPDYPARLPLLQLLARPSARRPLFAFGYHAHADALDATVASGRYLYLALLGDPAPEIQIAAAYLCARVYLSVNLRDLADKLFRIGGDAASDPHVRASCLVAAAGLCEARDPRTWPLGDPDPHVALAAAIAQAIHTPRAVTREALARLAAVPPDARLSPAQFPWCGGDVARFVAELLAHLALRPVADVLDELERGVRERADREHLRWLATSLVPRVFGAKRVTALDPDQRRLAHVLRYLDEPTLQRLGQPAAVSMVAARAALGIANRPLAVAPSLPLAAWTFAQHDELNQTPGDRTEIPAVVIVRGRGGVLGAVISADPSPFGDVLAGTGLVALRGGGALIGWLGAGGDCATVRVLSIDTSTDLAPLVHAPLTPRLRRLAILRDDSATLLAAPALRALEALSCYWPRPAALVAIAQLPALRELRLGLPFETARADFGALLATTRAPLRVLLLFGAEVPLDALAGNPALAGIEELDLARCDLSGGDMLAGLSELRVFRARGSTFDEVCADSLARCAKLEAVDLSETPVRSLAALDKISRIPALVSLVVPQRVLVELAIAQGEMRGVAVPTLADVRALEPVEPRRVAWAPAAHAEPPAGWTRRFVVDEIVACELCHGTGRAPDGPCADHRDAQHVVYDGPQPDRPDLIHWFLCAAPTVAAVEQLVARLAAELHPSPRELVFELSRTPRPPSRVDALAGATPLADTAWWPHAAYAATPSTLLALAAEIVDCGFPIHAITDRTVHLALPAAWRVTRR